MNFTKTHSFGNDFIIIDAKNLPRGKKVRTLCKKLCDRHTGIGADGCLIFTRSNSARVSLLIVNADGTTAAMCGNGVRCLSQYLFQKKIIVSDHFYIDTAGGTIDIQLILRNQKIAAIKIILPINILEKLGIISNYPMIIKDRSINLAFLNVGVPHTVIFADILDPSLLIELAAAIMESKIFSAEGVNVNLVKVINKNRLEVLTFERGVGLTKACGTGAIAASIVAYVTKRTSNKIDVSFELGTVTINLHESGRISMLGPPTNFICEGHTNIV